MKNVHCNIVKDLMLNYIDKVSSEETNKLIESHIQNCKECNETLNEMTKDIEFEPLIKQDEEIDYLKVYKKRKRKSIIFTIFLTTLIIVTIVMSILKILQEAEFFISVDDVNVAFTQKTDNAEIGKDTLTFLITPLNKKCTLKYHTYKVTKDLNNKSLHIKMVGKFGEPAGSFYSVDVDTSIKKIYLEDKNGNLLELWNKDNGFLIEDISDSYKINYNSQFEKEMLENRIQQSKNWYSKYQFLHIFPNPLHKFLR